MELYNVRVWIWTFTGTDYIRLTIYPAEAISNIVTLPNTNEQAIFYSSLNEQSFEINISPFGVGLDKLQFKRIGKDINPDTNQLYIKMVMIYTLNQMKYLTHLNYLRVIIKYKLIFYLKNILNMGL